MATSGTHAFTLDIGEIIEEAYERIGVESRSGYDYRTARRSLDLLLLEWQNKGLNLWSVKQGSQALTAGTASYTLDPERLDVIEAYHRTGSGTSQSDSRLTRMSISTYSQLTTKNMQGTPNQYWIDRTPTDITVTLWPVPQAADTLIYHYIERVEDTGKPGSNTVDVPARHLPALVAGLAYYLATKSPEKMAMVPVLREVYNEQWDLAADASRDKSSLFLRPSASY